MKPTNFAVRTYMEHFNMNFYLIFTPFPGYAPRGNYVNILMRELPSMLSIGDRARGQ